MRRTLPRTFLRPFTTPLRPNIPHPPRRAESTIPLLPLSNPPDPEHPERPRPAILPESAGSVQRTQPHKVAIRRKLWPSPSNYSESPLSDEEVWNLDSTKRMPSRYEADFERHYRRGFFSQDYFAARTQYLESVQRYRNRIRGGRTLVWDRRSESWKDASRKMSFLNDAKARGIELNLPEFKDLTEAEFAIARKDALSYDDLDAAKVKSVSGKEVDQVDIDELTNDQIRAVVNMDGLYKKLCDPESPYSVSATQTELVAHRVYLPNIVIRLMRNYTPPGEPYDPWVATFRMPTTMTKTDLRSYLKATYNLDVTFIRTDIYWGKVIRDRKTGRRVREKGGVYNYKRAVVGLYEPFHYPDDTEELNALGHATGREDEHLLERERLLELNFMLKENRGRRAIIYQKMYKNTARPRTKGASSSAVSFSFALTGLFRYYDADL